jgi:HPt (histidine-containing phosphotransfer) domain-containing protein
MDDTTRRGGILAGQIAALGPAFRQRLVRDRHQLDALLATIAGAGDAPGDAGALREVELAAHKLHGTSAMFGYERLGLAAGRLEAAAHEAIAQAMPGRRAVEHLGATHAELLAEIDAALDGTPEASG